MAPLLGNQPARTVGEFKRLVPSPEMPQHNQLHYRYRSRPTLRAQLRFINDIRTLDQGWDDIPLEVALVNIIQSRKEKCRWKWVTMNKAMGTASGAMLNLQLFDPSIHRFNCYQIVLAERPLWVACAQAVQKLVCGAIPDQVEPLTLDQVLRFCKDDTVSKDMALQLAIGWSLCGRLGDVLQTSWRHLKLEGNTLSYLWTVGKTVELTRRPYHVTSKVHPDLLPLLTDAIAAKEQGDQEGHIFHFPSSKARSDQITAFNKKCKAILGTNQTSRAIRRGAVQHLSAMGATPDEIILITGHTTTKCLSNNYLDQDRKNCTKREAGKRLGDLLCQAEEARPRQE